MKPAAAERQHLFRERAASTRLSLAGPWMVRNMINAPRALAETVFPFAAGTERRLRCFPHSRRKHSKTVQDNKHHIEQQINNERQKHKLQRYAPYEIPRY